MGRHNGKVYEVIDTYGSIKDAVFKQNLIKAYMTDIEEGCCERLYEFNEFTKNFSKKDNMYDLLTSSFAAPEIKVLIEVYNRLADKKDKVQNPIINHKITREMVVYLCDLAENNKNRLKSNNDEYICDIDPFVVQYDGAKKNTERGDSMSFDIQEQSMDGNPYFEEIEQFKNLIAQKDKEIEVLKKGQEDLKIQLLDIDRQFKIKKEELKEEKIALENEYNQKKIEFEASMAEKKAALEVELQGKREEEEKAFENNRREKALMVESYYENERQKAEKEIDAYKTHKMAEVDSEAQEWYEKSLKGMVGDYLKEKETSWKDGHHEFDDIRQNITSSIGAAKLEGCNEASRIQRELVEQMNSAMAQFGANMDKWRDSMYSAQFADFASWASKFFGFVDRFDKRIADNMDNGAISPDIIRLGKTLVSLRNQLDRAMTGMGLRCFYPQAGTKYDPVCHEVDTDEEIGLEAEIQECKNPGVEMGLADASNALVLTKAEVRIKE